MSTKVSPLERISIAARRYESDDIESLISSSRQIGDDDNVTAFVERWKEVISDGEEEKMNAIYDEMVEIVQLFSVAFMV